MLKRCAVYTTGSSGLIRQSVIPAASRKKPGQNPVKKDSLALIRPPCPADGPAWRGLWEAYNRFYRANVTSAATDATWARILAPGGDVAGLVAETASFAVAGFAHFVLHPSTWSTAPACYSEDLFVAPAARGGDIASALIEAVAEAARARGASRFYWHTQEFNGAARSLYDTLASRTSFIVYQKEL